MMELMYRQRAWFGSLGVVALAAGTYWLVFADRGEARSSGLAAVAARIERDSPGAQAETPRRRTRPVSKPEVRERPVRRPRTEADRGREVRPRGPKAPPKRKTLTPAC